MNIIEKEYYSQMTQEALHNFLWIASLKGYLEEISYILDSQLYQGKDNNKLIEELFFGACWNGHAELMTYMAEKRSGIFNIKKSQLFYSACSKKELVSLKTLLSMKGFSNLITYEEYKMAMKEAIKKNNVVIVQYLLNDFPDENHSYKITLENSLIDLLFTADQANSKSVIDYLVNNYKEKYHKWLSYLENKMTFNKNYFLIQLKLALM